MAAPDSLRFTGLLLKESWGLVKRRTWLSLGLTLACFSVAFFTMPHDAAWIAQIRQDPTLRPDVHQWAARISYYGMFIFTPLGLCALVWVLGWLKKSRCLKYAAIACLVSGTVSGLVVNIFRPAFGRPRPRAVLEADATCTDRFYYFQFDSDRLSFPSGHAMSNVSAAVTLSLLQPIVGLPYLLFSVAIGWSRIQRYAHYPTDILVGSLLGILTGVLYTIATRKVIRSRPDASEQAP